MFPTPCGVKKGAKNNLLTLVDICAYSFEELLSNDSRDCTVDTDILFDNTYDLLASVSELGVGASHGLNSAMSLDTASALQLLDAETRSKLRSTQILTSLSQIISELVQNALDADATEIHAAINVAEWECRVQDNGVGISKDGMKILAGGSSTGRYASSKAYSINSLNSVSTFGFRGEALASAADVCYLEISSRTKTLKDTWSVILKGGKQLYYGPAIHWKRISHGTMVCIRDAFYNLPVRRKSHPSQAKTLETVKQDLRTFALLFPHVQFVLEDLSETSTKQHRGKVITIQKSPSTLDAFRAMFGNSLAANVHIVHEGGDGCKIGGFIGLEGTVSKAYQYLFLNKRPLEVCELHGIIDSLFARSTFWKQELCDESPTKPNIRRSPRKLDKRPIYVLHIQTSQKAVDALLQPSKTVMYLANLNDIENMLTRAINTFLQDNGYMTKAAKHSENLGDPSYPGRISPETSEEEYIVRKAPSSLTPLRAASDVLPKGDERPGARVHINMETGRTIFSEAHELSGLSRIGINQPRSTGIDSPVPSWIQGILEESRLETFGPSERRVVAIGNRNLSKQDHKMSITLTNEDLAAAEVLGQVDCKFVACITAKKPELDSVLVLIDQHAMDERIRVEKLLAEFFSGAAERSRTKSTSQFEVPVYQLDPPTRVLMTRNEMARLGQDSIRQELSRWGFDYLVLEGPSDGDEGYGQVEVEQVPKILRSRLSQTSELADVMKSILSAREAQDPVDLSVSESRGGDKEDADWRYGTRYCPRPLVDLINSQACRGAVMFNDPLSLDQCRSLVSRLAACRLPFQCAHGRPSVVPLLSTSQMKVKGRHTVNWSEFGRRVAKSTSPL